MEKEERSRIKKRKKEPKACLSEIKAMKRKLSAVSKERDYFRSVFENSGDGIIIHDAQGRILDVNKTYYKRLGYKKSEMLEMSLFDLVSTEFGELIEQRVDRLKKEGKAVFESQDRRKDGTIIPVEVNAAVVDYKGREAIQSVVRDIHKHRIAEELIQRIMEDNKWLLNKFQRHSRFTSEVLMRILEKLAEENEKGRPQDEFAAVLNRQKIRINNFAFIQDLFYTSSKNTPAPLEIPIRRMISFSFGQLSINPCRIASKVEVGGVSLNLDRAVACCLLIAEFLTNALQHAFPDSMTGEIQITFVQETGGEYVLTFADTGVGFPKNFRIRRASTLGMQLILSFVQQMEGRIRLSRDRGTTFVVRFKS